MSTDIHTRIAIYNPDKNIWEEIKLYTHSEDFPIARFFSGKNYTLFDILDGSGGNLDPLPIRLESLDPSFKEEIKREMEAIGTYGFHEVNLADLKLFLAKNPKVEDPNSERFLLIENPVKRFIDLAETYVYFANYEWTHPSEIKILYWFDC